MVYDEDKIGKYKSTKVVVCEGGTLQDDAVLYAGSGTLTLIRDVIRKQTDKSNS